MILPPRDQSNVEYIKSDLRLRYFKNQPVQMELLDEAVAKTNMEEIEDGMRLQLQVDDQVRVRAHRAVSVYETGRVSCNSRGVV